MIVSPASDLYVTQGLKGVGHAPRINDLLRDLCGLFGGVERLLEVPSPKLNHGDVAETAGDNAPILSAPTQRQSEAPRRAESARSSARTLAAFGDSADGLIELSPLRSFFAAAGYDAGGVTARLGKHPQELEPTDLHYLDRFALGGDVLDVEVRRPTLDDVFLELTGKRTDGDETVGEQEGAA